MKKPRRFREYMKRSFVAHTVLLVGMLFAGFLVIVFFNYCLFIYHQHQ